MRAFILISGIIIIAFGLSTPWILGNQFKKSYFTFIQNNQKLNNIKIIEYKQGWLHSNVKLTISDPNIPSILIEQTVQHGPFIFNHLKFALAYVTSKMDILNDSQKSFASLQTNSLVHFNFDTYTSFTIPPININKNAHVINWEGASGDIEFSVNKNMRIQSFTYHLNIGHINIQNSEPVFFDSLRVNSITSTNTTIPLANDLLEVNHELSIPEIMIIKSGNNININNLNYRYWAGMEGAVYYKMGMQLAIKNLDIPILPITTISDINILLAVNNIDAKALAPFLKNIHSMSAENRAAYLLQKNNLQTLAANSNATMQMSANTTYGALSVIGKVNIDNAASMLDNFLFTANIKIAIPLFNQLADLFPGYFKSITRAPKIETNSIVVEENTNEPDSAQKQFNQHIALLVQNGQIPLSVALKIMEASNQKLSIDAFTAQLKELQLSPTLINDITQEYQLAMSIRETAKTEINVADDQEKSALNDWVANGYFTQEGNNYITTLTYQHGKILLNGKEIK